jgi:glycerate dehydrogenase
MTNLQRAKCVFLDRDSIDLNDLDFGEIEALTQFSSFGHTAPEQVVQHSQDAEIIIVNKVVLNEQTLNALPLLKFIGVIATGTNNIDIAAASRLGIKVCNVKDYSASAVSQHVFMLILALYTRFREYQQDITQGKWQAQDQFCLLSHPIQELQGKTIGLIGYGHIARAVERIALAFGMRVLIAQSLSHQQSASTDRVPLQELLKESDVISLHCPLSDQSKNLIGAEQFAMMKNTAIIINAARGGIINEADLLHALESGEIAGAGIDSLVTEPPTPSDPMIQARLPQLIITPHNAWGAVEARQRLVNGTADNIRAYLDNTLDQDGQIQSLTA